MKKVFFYVLIFWAGLVYSQTFDEYSQFTHERRLVLDKMGAFFDETIRKNFPNEKDALSYINFHHCFWQTGVDGFHIVIDVDKVKLGEINKMLFKDHVYSFFYVGVDSISSKDANGTVKRKKYLITPVLNRDGYISVLPEDIPVIGNLKDDFANAGGLSPSSYAIDSMMDELSNPQVKEYLAVIFWKYFCILAGVDLEERKSICETCDLY